MTKEQIIQAVLKKATEANCDWHNEANIDANLSALYDNCKNELGEERFNFYARHHRLTDLLYKLQNGIPPIDQLKQLDTFSLENDRALPRLLQADEHELSSSAAEIAEYDLYEYNPRHHPYTRATNGKNSSDPDFDKYQKKNKVAQKFLQYVFDEVMMPMAEKRADLYKKLRPFYETLQKQKERMEALTNDPSLAHWTMSMLPSTSEQDYLKRQSEELLESAQLLEDKIDLFSATIDNFCYEMRLVEGGKERLWDSYCQIRDILEKHTHSGGRFSPHHQLKKTCVNNAYRLEKFSRQFEYELLGNCKTPTGRAIQSKDYVLRLTDTNHKAFEDDNHICVYCDENTWKAQVYYNKVFIAFSLEGLTPKQKLTLNTLNEKRQERSPEIVREDENAELVKAILRETTSKVNTAYCTEKTENQFGIYKLETKKLSENRHHGFYNFMRGLAGLVLAPLRALFYPCAPKSLKEQSFYRTQSHHCFYRAEQKMFQKSREMKRDHPSHNNSSDNGWFHPDVQLKTSEDERKPSEYFTLEEYRASTSKGMRM